MTLGRKLGGRKSAWDEATRRDAMERARRDGPEVASRATGVPSGTIRSWLRREVVRAERDRVVLTGLEAVKAEGRRIVEEHVRRIDRDLERYGPPPLAPGEYLSPDPYEGQRPPPGTPWPPVDDEAPPVEAEDES